MIEIPNYTIEKEVGRGGMATVYLAVQDMLSRHVALKVMLSDMARDENFRKSFLSEGKIIANLEHPNIVRIHDVGIIDDSILYMAMEYLAGGTLKEKLNDRSLSYAESLRILEQVSNGLAYAHAKGYIHRDVKPGNILFRDNGTVVLTDFGIAKLQDTSGELTRMGYTMGTVQYMSPEQAVTTDLDQRSDVYSLGLVFYEMLTGQKAFKAESTIQAIHQHTTVAPPQLPEKYGFLQGAIDKVLAKEPDDRYQTVDEFVEAIRSAADVDKTVINKIPTQTTSDKTQILKSASGSSKSNKSRTGLIAGIIGGIVLLGALAFGATNYSEFTAWLNGSENNDITEKEKQIAETKRKEKEQKLAEEIKRQEQLKLAEEEKKAQEKQETEVSKTEQEQQLAIEKERRLTEEKRLEEEGQVAEEKKEQQRIAEQKKADKKKLLVEEKKRLEEKIRVEEKQKETAEANKKEKRRMAEAKKKEEKRLLTEAKEKDEAKRLAEEKAKQEARIIAEEKQQEEDKQSAEAKEKEEAKRLAEDKKKEEDRVAEAKKKEEKQQREKKRKAKEKKRLAKQKRLERIRKEKAALAKKKAEIARKKKKYVDAWKRKEQEKKRLAATKGQQPRTNNATQRGHIKVTVLLNGLLLNTKVVISRNGKAIKTINRAISNSAFRPGRYVVTAFYGGKSSRATVNLGANETSVHQFSFRGSAAAKVAKPQVDRKWTHTHTPAAKKPRQLPKKETAADRMVKEVDELWFQD